MPYRRCFLLLVTVAFASAALAQSAPPAPATPHLAPAATPPAGRYQLVVVPGRTEGVFMIDTATGCVWHSIEDEKSKRATFMEVNVENLHWTSGSGAQTLLAARIDAATIPDEQKRTLKQALGKTGCGVFNVVLAPGPASPQGGPPAQEPEKKPTTSPEPKKPKK